MADSAAAFPATDAMITDLPGVALTILVADCAPVVLYDPVRRAVGVAHSGRVGTIQGVVPQTVEAMAAAFGSDPADLLIGIGPAIGAASYEIGPAEAAGGDGGVRRRGGAAADPDPARARHVRPGRARSAASSARPGVPAGNVHDMAIDTRTPRTTSSPTAPPAPAAGSPPSRSCGTGQSDPGGRW